MHLNLKIYLFIAASISSALTFSQELKPTQIFERNSKSIVLIVTFDHQGTPIAQGSGVVLPNNMVATNCHVVSKSSLIGIEQKDKRRIARVTATYPESDLCVLTADSPIGEPALLAIGDLAPVFHTP